jgi:hypothetical protein
VAVDVLADQKGGRTWQRPGKIVLDEGPFVSGHAWKIFAVTFSFFCP